MIKYNVTDVYYVCGLIEYLGRESKNERSLVVQAIGQKRIGDIYDLADVYHCEPLEQIAKEILQETKLKQGTFDNVYHCEDGAPGVWEIAKVYQRLIGRILKDSPEKSVEQVILSVFCSDISNWIQDFNCAWFYSDPEEIYQAYCLG